MKPLSSLLLSLSLLTLSACDKKESTSPAAPPASSGAAAQLSSLITPTEPGPAIAVVEARQDPTPGKEITVTGRIMGAMEVLADNRAILTLADPSKLTACSDIPGDSCETPWDNCCDDKDLVKQSILSIQAVDESGKILTTGFRGLGGIKELSTITVKGTIAPGSNKDVLMVNASLIYVKP
jgi:hypothetical protein